MKNTRRMKRMGRSKRHKAVGLSLTSLMDVFTILVLYLLVNQASGTVLEPPKDVKLPDSVVETKPRETLVITVSNDEIIVQGALVAMTPEVAESRVEVIDAIRDRMEQIRASALGEGEEQTEESKEVTIMGNRTIPFQVLKKVMASCTAAGYTRISLAVNQK